MTDPDATYDTPPPGVIYKQQRLTVSERPLAFEPPELPRYYVCGNILEYHPWELVASHAVQLYDRRNENHPVVALVVVWRTTMKPVC